jgi:hypothetical protein
VFQDRLPSFDRRGGRFWLAFSRTDWLKMACRMRMTVVCVEQDDWICHGRRATILRVAEQGR